MALEHVHCGERAQACKAISKYHCNVAIESLAASDARLTTEPGHGMGGVCSGDGKRRASRAPGMHACFLMIRPTCALQSSKVLQMLQYCNIAAGFSSSREPAWPQLATRAMSAGCTDPWAHFCRRPPSAAPIEPLFARHRDRRRPSLTQLDALRRIRSQCATTPFVT